MESRKTPKFPDLARDFISDSMESNRMSIKVVRKSQLSESFYGNKSIISLKPDFVV